MRQNDKATKRFILPGYSIAKSGIMSPAIYNYIFCINDSYDLFGK